MPCYDRGDVHIYYEEAGSGFPLLLIPGGGLSSTISCFTGGAPLNAIEELKGEYRCITADRIPAAVMAQPSGFRPELPDLFYTNNLADWWPALCARRPDTTMEMVDAFLTAMYRSDPDFVFTVSRELVRACQTPILVLPDDTPGHPYAVAMEVASLAPRAEVSIYPWKQSKTLVPDAVRHIRACLQAHNPATTAR